MDSSDGDESQSVSTRKIIKVSKRYCPHCQETLSYKTYRIHKRLYFDSYRSSWLAIEQPQDEERALSSSIILEPSPPTESFMDTSPSLELARQDESPPRDFHHDVQCGFTSESSEGSSDIPCSGKFYSYMYA